ncbi:hypothetical protein V491_00791 [Pseudogymnoascus sp. VKM F-3775]|nr:hypothetical protein V491_00791 [Pseudogymnoascus sp. VKM F-3775]
MARFSPDLALDSTDKRGSGHEPAHAGYVGEGMLDVAVVGNIFASPSAAQVFKAIRAFPSEQGTLIITKNYTGDVLSFGLAAEKAKAAGLKCKLLVVGDDISIPCKEGSIVGRRGLAGTALVQKIAGAAAAEGNNLQEVYEIAKSVADNLATIGVSLDRCHVPGRTTNLENDTMGNAELEYGMGIHNEPGVQRSCLKSLEETVRQLLSRLFDENESGHTFITWNKNDDIALSLNNLGGLSVLELHAILDETMDQLSRKYCITPRRVLRGTMVSSFNGLGFSITLLKLSDKMIPLLDRSTSAPGWVPAAQFDNELESCEIKLSSPDTSFPLARMKVEPCVFHKVLDEISKGIGADEPAITYFDTITGDGDCGETLLAGSNAITAALQSGQINTSDLISGLHTISSVVEHSMGGTSGAIYSIYLNALVSALSKIASTSSSSEVNSLDLAAAGAQALNELFKYTQARVGSRTMMDVLIPFIEHLAARPGRLENALAAAIKGAEATKKMEASFGRASYVDKAIFSKVDEGSGDAGIPDAGALGVLSIFRAIFHVNWGSLLEQQRRAELGSEVATMFTTPFDDESSAKKRPNSRSRQGCLTCRRRRLKWTNVHRPLAWKFVDNTEEIENGYYNYGLSPDNLDDRDDNGADLANAATLNKNDVLIDPVMAHRSKDTPDAPSLAGGLCLETSDQIFVSSDQQAAYSPTSSRNQPHEQDRRMRVNLISGVESDISGNFQASQTFSPSEIATPSPSSLNNGDNLPPWPIDDKKKAMLIASYLRETATWCETTDSMRHFSLQTSQDLLTSQAHSAASVAVASRQQDNLMGDARLETLELYDFARETICSLETWQNDKLVLAGALQLCVYCMMSMEVNEWRLHLRGCAGTFQEMGWNGSSGGLPAACFWAFARIDIWAAYLTQQRTLIPTDFWISSNYDEEGIDPLQDRYANKAIWIFGRLINELSELGQTARENSRSYGPYLHEFWQLWNELDAWKAERPASMKSLIELEPSKGDVFPFILYGNFSASKITMPRERCCILLLEAGLKPPSNADNSPEFSPLWHARRIGGISLATDSHANWVNNLQPLFIAARHYTEAGEMIAILKHLKDIEVTTGWKTSSRSTELRALWGLG